MCKASAVPSKYRESNDLNRLNMVTGRQDRQRLRMETRNGAWLATIRHLLNGTELSWEEF